MSSDQQCAFLLKDSEAKMDHDEHNMYKICERMYCKSPTKTGYFAAGPALEGTRCSKSDNKVSTLLVIDQSILLKIYVFLQ